MTRIRTILAAAVGLISMAAVFTPASAQTTVWYDRWGRPHYRYYERPRVYYAPPAYYYPPPPPPRAYYRAPRSGFSFYFSG